MSGMTNPSDDQPDTNKPAEGSTPTPPAPSEPTQQPEQTKPMYGQTSGEQPANPYGGASFDQSPPAPPAPSYGYQPTAFGAPTGVPDQKATTSMVLGIVGLVSGFFCGIGFFLSPFAMFMGTAAKKRIDASNGALRGRESAQAGFITGLIGTILLALAIIGVIIFVVIFVVIGANGGFDDPSSYSSYDSEF